MSHIPLSSVSHCKYLGPVLQFSLILYRINMYNKSQENNSLSMLQLNIKIETKTLVYQSLVRCQLEYAAKVWLPWQSKTFNAMQPNMY